MKDLSSMKKPELLRKCRDLVTRDLYMNRTKLDLINKVNDLNNHVKSYETAFAMERESNKYYIVYSDLKPSQDNPHLFTKLTQIKVCSTKEECMSFLKSITGTRIIESIIIGKETALNLK